MVKYFGVGIDVFPHAGDGHVLFGTVWAAGRVACATVGLQLADVRLFVGWFARERGCGEHDGNSFPKHNLADGLQPVGGVWFYGVCAAVFPVFGNGDDVTQRNDGWLDVVFGDSFHRFGMADGVSYLPNR